MRAFLIRLHWLLSAQFGLDPRLFFRGIVGLPRYFAERARFRRLYRGKIRFRPALHDRRDQAGALSEYFWQDITAARLVADASPSKHVDVGSLLTGFVSYVAMRVPVEAFDIRPLDIPVPNVTFVQADLMAEMPPVYSYTDSLSCLHTIEHFGLGRYGDPLMADGRERGIRNLATMLKPGGKLYLSTPVGKERVDFNANWVSDPSSIVAMAASAGLSLKRLFAVDHRAAVEKATTTEELGGMAALDYILALFVFEKSA